MAGCQYKFNIVNMMKPDASYNDGMKPIYYSDAEALISGMYSVDLFLIGTNLNK